MTSFAVTGLNIGGVELTGASGGTLVGYGTTTAQDILNAVTLPDYPSLRAYSGLSKNVSITGYSGTAAPSGIAGDFTVDTTDTTSGAVFTGSIAPVTSPAVPVLSATAGGTIAATTYFVKITYVTAAGETLPSTEASLAVAANNVLNVASPAAQTGVTGYNVYVSTATGTETKQNTSPIAIGTAWVEPTTGLIAGANVPAANTSGSVLTVSTVTNGTLSAYLTVNGSGVSAGTYVISLIGGTGGAGTYLVNLSQSVASVGMTADNGGAIIIDALGRRWKRQASGEVNPKWFGAKLDGITDDALPTNASLVYAQQINSCVKFSKGKCYINRIVNLLGNVSIFGSGKSSTEIWFGSSGQFQMTGTSASPIGRMSIQDIGITNQGGGAAVALLFTYVIRITIDNVVVYGTSMNFQAFTYCTITNSDLFSGVLTCGHTTANLISDTMKLSKINASGYAFNATQTADISLSQCSFLGGSAQINIQRGSMPANFYTPVFMNNVVVDSGDNEGIYLVGVVPHLSNIFASCGRTNLKSGIYLSDCIEGSLSGIQSRFNGQHGLWLGFCKNLCIQGSAFFDNKGYGIRIGDSTQLIFSGNKLGNESSWFGGNYVQTTGIADDPSNSTYITFVNNEVSTNTTTSVYLPDATNVLFGNHGYGENRFSGTIFKNNIDNVCSIGTAANRFTTVYAVTGTINTSDAREKTVRTGGVDAAAIRAWSRVEYSQFKWKEAEEKKGDSARWHFGVIAQEVKSAFESEGLDPFEYGILCYDTWELSDGTIVDRYGVRYEEALALECAYLRSKFQQ